jgi:hypothetical protein
LLFVTDGTNWVTDPDNPDRTQDGFDNAIRQVSCPAVCDGPDAGAPAADPGTASDWRRDLGINVLWLSNVLDTPPGSYQGSDGYLYAGYHGYWPGDLFRIEEHLGDRALMQAVVDEAHRQGIRVILDYVMNHVHQATPSTRAPRVVLVALRQRPRLPLRPRLLLGHRARPAALLVRPLPPPDRRGAGV